MTWQSFQTGRLIRFWSPVPAVIAAGILSTYYFGITGTFWAVTGESPLGWSGLLQLLGVHSEQWGYYQLIHLEGSPLTRIDAQDDHRHVPAAAWPPRCGRITSNCACHAAGSALRRPWRAGHHRRVLAHVQRWAATWRPSSPAFRSSPCTPGCLPSPPPSAPGLAPPASRCCPFSHPGKNTKGVHRLAVNPKPQQARRRFRLGMVVFFAMIGWGLLTAADHPALGLAMLFGIAFGLLIERAQICFTSAFRDMWITGRTVMAKAIIFGTAASAIGIFSYVQLGMAPKIMWAGPNAAIGGLLFWLWHRAGRRLWDRRGCTGRWRGPGSLLVGLGWATSSAQRSLAWCWDDIAAPPATHWQKVNLLNASVPLADYGQRSLAADRPAAGDRLERHFSSAARRRSGP